MSTDKNEMPQSNESCRKKVIHYFSRNPLCEQHIIQHIPLRSLQIKYE